MSRNFDSRTAWLAVVLLLPVALLNYLDRQMLASMKFSVMADIPTIETEANWGRMLGQFKWVYAVLSPLGGFLADRFSRRLTIVASLFGWSLVTWWTGRVTTYSELLWARSLMGFSEAFYIPAALALISEYHSRYTRSRAVGLHQMAIYCGVILGGFGGLVADAPMLGWRVAFWVCGILGMVYALPLAIFLKDAPNQPTDYVQEHERKENVFSWSHFAHLFRNLSFLLLVLYFTLPAMAAWVVRDWMPAILKQEFELSQTRAGIAATVSWQLAAIVGVLVGGALADHWSRTQPRGRIFISAMGVSLIVPAIFGVGNAPYLWVAVVFLVVFGIGWGFFDGNNMPILSQIVPPKLLATGYGIMNFVSISCGGFADWGFGILRDQSIPLNVIFGIFAFIALGSIIPVLLIRPRQFTNQGE